MAGRRDALTQHILHDCVGPLPEAAQSDWPGAILNQCPDTAAILYYGSGLWEASTDETVHDFYVLVDHYTDFDDRRLRRVLGSILPPNVYFQLLQQSDKPDTSPLKAKITVMRFDQFCRQARGKARTPQIWARFAQPCRLVYARDDAARDQVLEALRDAVITFHNQNLPLMPATFTPRQLWTDGLKRSYACEWRGEGEARITHLVETANDSLKARSYRALDHLERPVAIAPDGVRLTSDISDKKRRKAQRRFSWYRRLSKTVTLLRLLKATVTFDGAVDYALWKIKRQSGVAVHASNFQRRHPLIGCWPLMFKVIRRGGLR
jgi:hypothetical protein